MRVELFHRWGCPYSAKVRNYLNDNKLTKKLILTELEDELDAIERLVRLTGGQQVPCLVIDGRPMLESERIIQWLKDHLLTADQSMSA